ncbi:MAG: thiamine-phosphate kinase [Gammaproteobacteria bacterium]|nr:thiamine-phosphate kinase [Gammaproteobacteria bacterium]
MLSESDIIHTLKTHFPEQIGDDAAAIPLTSTTQYLISKDLLVEDTHFRLRYHDASSLAHKALHVNLSDLAAMGATPQFVMLGLSIPPHFEQQTPEFLDAFSNACKAASVILIGGDTTRSEQQLLLSITAIGTANTSNIKFRCNTKPGDLLCIAGSPGNAHLGLIALEHNKPDLLDYKQHFLNPTARIHEGIWLGKQAAVTSMMDVSDGLLIDLGRLCKQSDIACEINLDILIPDDSFKSACEALKLDAMTTQLAGGEDYALMFSVAPDAYLSLKKQFKHLFKYEPKCVGVFHTGQDVTFTKGKQQFELNIKPFLHFE